jgi:hypothetical protein
VPAGSWFLDVVQTANVSSEHYETEVSSLLEDSAVGIVYPRVQSRSSDGLCVASREALEKAGDTHFSKESYDLLVN